MWSTCIFCHHPLGANEVIEQFPVGRRLAFDGERGRLWVVCRRCEKWNLSPLEERWEAMEACERLYRSTRLRVATDQIGLAKLADGTELVRIGRPLRPEFAAWRYGDQFGRRRRGMLLRVGLGLGALGGVLAGGLAVGVSLGGAWYGLWQLTEYIVRGSPEQVVAKLRKPGGDIAHVRRRHLNEMRLVPGETDDQFGIFVRAKNDRFTLHGPEAVRAAGILLPAANRFGGSRTQVAAAVGAIEQSGGSEPFLLETARRQARDLPVLGGKPKKHRQPLALAPELRLAAEMAAHEESERRALEGELIILEEAWRQAEEIAGIADNLLVSDQVERKLRGLRGLRIGNRESGIGNREEESG
jgi:hypothetical protein